MEESVRPDNSIEISCDNCGVNLGWIIPTNLKTANDMILSYFERNYDDIEEEEIPLITPKNKDVSYKIHCYACDTVSGPHYYNEDANYEPPLERFISDAITEKGINEIWLA